MGKSYATRNKKEDRPLGDFYSTPISLVWELYNLPAMKIDYMDDVLEPCCGKEAISNELKLRGFNVTANDLYYKNKINFLEYNKKHKSIITNPPFSEFDEFVLHSKKIANNIFMIAKTNFFGTKKRIEKGVWKHLKNVYIFNRQIDYRTPYRDDGLFNVGNLVTGWFHWDLSWDKKYWNTEIIDIDKYAKLGQYKESV